MLDFRDFTRKDNDFLDRMGKMPRRISERAPRAHELQTVDRRDRLVSINLAHDYAIITLIARLTPGASFTSAPVAYAVLKRRYVSRS